MPGRGAFDFHGCRDIQKKEAFPFYLSRPLEMATGFFLLTIVFFTCSKDLTSCVCISALYISDQSTGSLDPSNLFFSSLLHENLKLKTFSNFCFRISLSFGYANNVRAYWASFVNTKKTGRLQEELIGFLKMIYGIQRNLCAQNETHFSRISRFSFLTRK